MERHEQMIAHHGIKGMKWGVRRFQNKDGTRTALGKKREQSSKTEDSKKNDSTVKKPLTDDELRQRISRLELEKRYRELSKDLNPQKVSKGKAFVMNVLEKSGSNIATQLTTYAMGAMVNKLVGSEIVNPKKGQKDK